ncbi:uncharacterized protein [Montipora foliosa]|uniref:uncharacterized protein isoform X1 n=1 Tax=Montipora foliosa TaxID=591990 RepID=UPI0035F16BD7
MREKVFDDDMEEEIDVFDLECKEWGFSLRDLFGLGLGTGDYGHLTVEHASMLLRNFRSLRHYSNQGFEAAHKLQKQIFSRATNHDGSGEATSLDQILTSHYDMSKPKIRRSLFTPCKRKCMEAPLQNLSSVKRKASSTPSSPLLLSPTLPSTPRSNTSHTVPSKPSGRKLPLSDTLEFSATTSPPSVASGQIPSASTLPSDSSDFLASTLSATILPPSDMRRLPSSPPLAANTMQGTKPRQFPLSIPSDPENVMLHSSSLPSFSRVFSSTCPREIILTNPLPPVDRSITAQQNTLMRVPGDFVFTDVTELKTRPPASVVHAAVNLIRQEKKFSDESGKPIDLDIEDEATGIAIGQLGIFSRTGLGHLEWLGEIAEMQLSVKEEEKWLMQSPDDLDNETREKCLHVLKKCPLNYLVASEGKCSVTVRAFSNLCLERYIDDSVIDTTIARLHRQSTCKEGVLCLPAHTMTWLDTGDKKFIHECFKERLVEVNPEKLSLVLVPVNLSGTHWGLLVIDVRLKEVYFDDGLRWTFSNMSCVLQIVRELHFVFPGCDHFSLRHWLMLKTFKRFGMPRQPGGGQVIGSGSCGVGVILSVKDFIMSGLPFRPSWTFNEMTVHRKNIMKLLLSSQ